MMKLVFSVLLLAFGLAAASAAGTVAPSEIPLAAGTLAAAPAAGSAVTARTFLLPARARSGRARDGETPAIASLSLAGSNASFQVRMPGGTDGSGEPGEPLRLALMFWNRGAPPLPAASVLFLTVPESGSGSLGGAVMAAGTAAGPRLLRSAGVWQSLGAAVQVTWDRQGAMVVVSLPVAALAEIAPDGLLFDARVMSGGRLFSLAPAASWAEPPDPGRAESISLPGISSSAGFQGRLAALAAAARPLAGPPGAQLWVWSREPPPLEAAQCRECAEASSGGGVISPAQIESSLRILEDDLTAPPAIVSALRNLGRALSGGGIQLREDPELRARLLAAVRDENGRAAYGADLLLLQEMEAEARILLKEVVANEAAAAAARAHALWRLEQLSAAAGDWAAAVEFAGRLAATAPFDLSLRAASLGLLSLEGEDPASAPELGRRVQTLIAAFAAEREGLCGRYFGGVAGCPLIPKETR